jgi:hypothetical protein
MKWTTSPLLAGHTGGVYVTLPPAPNQDSDLGLAKLEISLSSRATRLLLPGVLGLPFVCGFCCPPLVTPYPTPSPAPTHLVPPSQGLSCELIPTFLCIAIPFLSVPSSLSWLLMCFLALFLDYSLSFCCGKLQAEIWDTEAVKQETMIYCASTDPADLCPKAEPWEQRCLTNKLQKQKARSNANMVIFNSIGYITFSPSQCYVTLPMFRFLRFYLSATLSELGPSLFSFDPPSLLYFVTLTLL